MNIEELEEALEELFHGGFSIETDTNGQIVIYTGLTQDDEGELVASEEDEDEDEDLDDEDTEPLGDDGDDD